MQSSESPQPFTLRNEFKSVFLRNKFEMSSLISRNKIKSLIISPARHDVNCAASFRPPMANKSQQTLCTLEIINSEQLEHQSKTV